MLTTLCHSVLNWTLIGPAVMGRTSGVPFAPGGDTLIVSVTQTGRVYALERSSGSFGPPRVLLQAAPGIAGLAIDDSGRIYLDEAGAVGVYTSAGKPLCRMTVEAEHVSNVGLSPNELLVTAADRLFRVTLGR
jgi:sugar lactone lactonase YvrE